MTETCETRLLASNQACGHAAKFKVQIGTRQHDAQFACGQHLARACMVMAAGDGILGDPYKPVTVTMLAPV